MSDTLKSMRGEITRWLRGDLQDQDGQSQINNCINDAIARFWSAAMRVQLSRFVGSDSPVTFTVAAGAERVALVTLADPLVQIVAGTMVEGALPDRTYNLGFTYVTESGSETLQSPVRVWHVNANSIGTVTAPAPIPGAFGWNLYAGQINQALQNQNPLPFGVTLNEPDTGWQDYPVFQQTPPTVNRTADNIAYIEHMEFVASSGSRIAWNQHEIDSSVMRMLGAMLPVASEYTKYAWDLIDGHTIEIRPTAGQTYNPRYWYVARPRVLRYDQAEIPYASITGLHEYIRKFSLADCKLSLEEYSAAEAWDAAAGKALLELILAMNQENWNKGKTITPYRV